MTTVLPFIGIVGKEYDFKTPEGSKVKLEKRLGTGLAGEVWLVSSGSEKYALKVYTDPLADPRKQFMFDIESKMNIDDRRTVGPLASGPISDSSVGVQHAILFPYVESTRLDKWVMESPDITSRLSLCQSIAGMMSQLRNPLGWLHNDMKPENILVVLYGKEDDAFEGEREEIRIIDFQLSCKVSDVDKVYGRRKMPGGTPPYMAPEVCVLGGGARCFSTASDVWALSATLLYTITGKTLWDHLGVEDQGDFLLRAGADLETPIVGHEAFDLCDENVPMGIQRAILEGLIPNPLLRIGVMSLNHILKSNGISSNIGVENIPKDTTKESLTEDVESALGCKVRSEFGHHYINPISGLKGDRPRVLVDVPLSEVSKHYGTQLPCGGEVCRYTGHPEGSSQVTGKRKGVFRRAIDSLRGKDEKTAPVRKLAPKPAVRPKEEGRSKPKSAWRSLRGHRSGPASATAKVEAPLPHSDEGYMVRLILNTNRPDQPIYVPPDEEIQIGRKNIAPGNDEIRSRHISLMASDSGLKIKARSPIRLNGEDLQKGEVAPLSPASIIEVGGIVVKIAIQSPKRLD